MDYNQAIDFLYSQLPMYQRQGSSAFKKDLTNTIFLLDKLNNPHQNFKSVHIAGTNGKGSSAHFIASILQSAGYVVGLYTSPHLKSFTERIRVNGEPIDEEYVSRFVGKIKPVLLEVSPSFFEMTVVMAFEYFSEMRTDVAIVEVGLGGRLDSTNVIVPEVSLITNISSDHTDMLGKTLVEIAGEKAGIIKPNIPVVIGKRQMEVEEVFIEKARQEDSSIYFAEDFFTMLRQSNSINVMRNYEMWIRLESLPIATDYIIENLHGVLQTIEILKQKGFKISTDNIKEGLENMVSTTGLKGRWQRLSIEPLTFCDVAHNLDGITQVLHEILKQDYRKLIMVWGCVSDKDIDPILSILPKEANYIFCCPQIPRGLNSEILKDKAKKHGLKGISIPKVEDAYKKAIQKAKEGDMIFIGGSTFVVAELPNL